jgi:hypothetical protein
MPAPISSMAAGTTGNDAAKEPVRSLSRTVTNRDVTKLANQAVVQAKPLPAPRTRME